MARSSTRQIGSAFRYPEWKRTNRYDGVPHWRLVVEVNEFAFPTEKGKGFIPEEER